MMGGSYTTSELLGGKRSSRRSARKSSRRSARKSSRRSARRTARRSARRTARRSARKSSRRSARKSSRRSARKSSGSYDCKKGCTEDKKGKYTGNEPSPKGFGYCARCTPLGTKMEGKDGNMWIVKKFSKGQRWVKY